MTDYDDRWVKRHTANFDEWWIRYLRKQEDKTELARSIALDAWLACRDDAEMELY
jgi:hypothetical protein